jgi:2,3-bisphosphoglycerate-independent phosphoglycerate mutase
MNESSERLLFLFLDGVGLGSGDPYINPFARAFLPNLHSLLGGNRLVADTVSHGILQTSQATLIGVDACLGIQGLPQSATGQTVLLTGMNIPEKIGYHYGPKPNPDVAPYLQNGTIFSEMAQKNFRIALLNAYPPSYFQAIETKRRLYSAIPQAVVNAGIKLKTMDDLKNGNALAADFTAQGWQTHLKINDIPLLTPRSSGTRLAELASQYHFSMFEYWLSDYAGHHQHMDQAVALLETFDEMLGGLINRWRVDWGLILITSDHGNLEDISTRRHTDNPVPVLLIGPQESRKQFIDGLSDLTGIAQRILQYFSPTARFTRE